MDSLAAQRDAFRKGIIDEAVSRTASMLGAAKPGFRIVNVPLVVGSQGVALAANDHVFFRLGLNGIITILTWSLAGTIAGASASGTITLDIQVGASLATVATICGTHKPALAAVAEETDQIPANDWTVQLTDPNWILATVTSTGGTLEVISLTLRCAVDSR